MAEIPKMSCYYRKVYVKLEDSILGNLAEIDFQYLKRWSNWA